MILILLFFRWRTIEIKECLSCHSCWWAGAKMFGTSCWRAPGAADRLHLAAERLGGRPMLARFQVMASGSGLAWGWIWAGEASWTVDGFERQKRSWPMDLGSAHSPPTSSLLGGDDWQHGRFKFPTFSDRSTGYFNTFCCSGGCGKKPQCLILCNGWSIYLNYKFILLYYGFAYPHSS